jgi:putative membrane protein
VANPVAIDATRLNAAGTAGSGLAPYFMAIALWVGALATSLVLPPFLAPGGRPRRWAGAIMGFTAGAAIGLTQAAVMVAALSLGGGIEVTRLAGPLVFAMLVAVTAAAVTQAFVALLGMRGWFLALLFVVLQLTAAGAWFPVETAPALFGALHPVMPMSYALDGLRTLITGGDAALVVAVAAHLVWLAGALAVTLVVAAWRSHQGATEVMPAAA